MLKLILGILLFAVAPQQQGVMQITIKNENRDCRILVHVLQGEQQQPVGQQIIVQADRDITNNVAIARPGGEITFRITSLGCPFPNYTHSERVDSRRTRITLVVGQQPASTWIAYTRL